MIDVQSPYDFDLPLAFCHVCKKETVVYRDFPEEADLDAAASPPLAFFCMDCDARLDRWGMTPEPKETPFATVKSLGYEILDAERRQGGGCGPSGCASKAPKG